MPIEPKWITWTRSELSAGAMSPNLALDSSRIGEVSTAVYGHASADEDNHRPGGSEVYEFDDNRSVTDMRPRRLRAKLIRGLESYLARTAADLDDRGQALILRRTALDQQREQLAEVEEMLVENRSRVGVDPIDGKIEIELDVLVGLLANLDAAETKGGNIRLTKRLLVLERECEQSSSLLEELQVMLQERDHEVSRLRGIVEAREGELARTAATLATLQSSLQELFQEFSARLAAGK